MWTTIVCMPEIDGVVLLKLTSSLVSNVYNFSPPSSGYYTFEARNLFYYMEPSSSAISSLFANAPVHRALVPGHLLFVRQGPVSPSNKIFLECSDAQQGILRTAGAQADTYVSDAVLCVYHQI
jgi:peptidyl-Lys metalloendopeptidase